jgi:glycosyltransferase involved in cell wall biosynthesis
LTVETRVKLAYLSNSWIPSRAANSIHVMKMCEAFARFGHQVTLVAPDVQRGLEAGVSDPYAFYGVDRSFQLTKLPWRAFKGRGWLYGWEAGRFARHLAVDVAFGRSLHACAVAARLGTPTMWEAHMLSFLRRRADRLLFQWMINAPEFKGMVVHCDALRRCVLKELPGLAEQIMVAHSGADSLPDDLKPADLGETGDRLQVGYVGQLYPGKGLEIIREMAARAPWADFHVVGGEQATLDMLCCEPTLPSNIRLHGFVPPSQTGRLRLAFDVLLAPYQLEVQIASGEETAQWMSPLKLFEYMAARKPILCSDLPVLREVIQHGRNGLLLPAGDAEAWINALQYLMTDPIERERLGVNAYADFLAQHTWQQRAGRVIDCLRGMPDQQPADVTSR